MLITGGTVGLAGTGGVVGGFSDEGRVYGNVVEIRGGTVDGHGVYGGINIDVAAVSNNTVSIFSGATIDATDIYGGLSQGNGDATHNTVNLYGGTLNAGTGVFGGGSIGGDAITGNTLNVDGFIGTVREINNFEFYKFFLPDTLTNGGTLITISGLNKTDLTGSSVQSITIHGQSALGHSDSVVLIDKVDGIFADTSLQAQKGASLIYKAT